VPEPDRQERAPKAVVCAAMMCAAASASGPVGCMAAGALLAAGRCTVPPCRVPPCAACAFAAPAFAAPACALGGTCKGTAVAVHTFVAWRGELGAPVRYMLTAPNDTIESPVNRPKAGVKASRLFIDSLLPPSRESRCRRACLPVRGSFLSYQLVEAFPATLTRHLALPCAEGFEFARLREKIHNLDQQQGMLLGVLSWSDPLCAGLAWFPACGSWACGTGLVLDVRGLALGCAGPPGSRVRRGAAQAVICGSDRERFR
jgi:hypothetical protein